MNKVRVMDQMPGCCRNCGGIGGPYFLDMEYMEDFHGRVYYCLPCFTQAANTMDFITPEQLAVIKEDHREELEEVKEAIKHGRTIDWLSVHSIDLSRFIAWLESEEIQRDNTDSRSKASRRDEGSAEQSDVERPSSLSVSF